MQKKQVGNLAIIVIVLLNILLWMVAPPSPGETNYTLQLIGEILASSAMILMSIAFVLSAKPKFLEPYFGGLDKMYQSHKQVAILSFLLIIAHFFVIPDSGLLGPGKALGMLAFIGLILLVLLSIAPRIPLISRLLSLAYDKWRNSHKLLGIFFIIGLIHYMMVDTISKQTVPGMYMLLFIVIGIIAYVYKQFIAGHIRPYRKYTVEQITPLNGTTVEVALKPQDKKLDFNAGQFLFVQFQGDRKLSEPHPFTISSCPEEENLRLSIKASGDWTRNVAQNLKPGTVAKLDGSYGMFDYKDGDQQQVWIAGGIGVTPFLSWIRDINGEFKPDVDFFYGVGSEAEALFWNEFETVANNNNNFRAHLQYSTIDGHLSADDIAAKSGNITNKHIYMCGPVKMIEGFARTFKKMGVPAKNVHYEEFNFR